MYGNTSGMFAIFWYRHIFYENIYSVTVVYEEFLSQLQSLALPNDCQGKEKLKIKIAKN